ncbi:MAG: AAA family ATPase [Deltaproteobacteria bacterium]|nr:AAA family ATPase [Deltaproteobacteria bacterium]
MIKKLKPEALRFRTTKAFLSFYKNPETFSGAKGVVGQERAITALETGIKLAPRGYNIYVSGMAGTGRMTTIRRTLEELEPACIPVPDRAYVYNFADHLQPVLLTFAPGQGKQFRDDMKGLVRVLRADLPKALESTQVSREREKIIDRFQRDEKKLFEAFAAKLKAEGFALIQVQEGGLIAPTVFPIVGEEAVSIDYLATLVKEGKLSESERRVKLGRHSELNTDLKRVLGEARVLAKAMHVELEKLQARWCSLILDSVMDELETRYADPKIRDYLKRVREHVLGNVDAIIGKSDRDSDKAMFMMAGPMRPEDPFWFYEVNLLTDGRKQNAICPIIEEDNPTYTNLFGVLEYNIAPGGMWTTDFRHIRAGSLLKADGGYLIVNALDVFKRPFVWDHLKRVLKTGKLVIQQPESYVQLAPLAIKPEPIELTVKVIMIGPDWLYHLLWEYEEEFSKTFKILSDFDSSMKLTPKAAKEFAAVLKSVCDRGKLKLLSADGLSALIEYGVELSGQRDRLTTRFTNVSDCLREAHHMATEHGDDRITRRHVEDAIQAKRERHGRTESRIQRMIEEGVLMIETRGKRVGQVNGLAVYSMGYTSFGKPTRITAVTAVGKAGIVNIERECGLSGPTHDKGVLILSGYLRQKYAQRAPLTLSASIAFEQSYGGVDGDSASSTEIYALLSSLSGLPIDQGLAVTGSVNQHGDIQPIGGVNEKIEGYFDVCKAQGLTGKQGVLIPHQNERHLMLRSDVVEAVRKGKFHIYAVKSIDEGIEILTGKKAGVMNKRGKYLAGTVHGLAQHRLAEISDLLAEQGGTESMPQHDIYHDRPPQPEPPKPPRQKGKRRK